MTELEEAIAGLHTCTHKTNHEECYECPYQGIAYPPCNIQLMNDALALLREYDTALKLMVFQYCVDDKNFYHRFMCAGEEAFRVLGIENGQLTDGVWEKWFPDEKEEDHHA